MYYTGVISVDTRVSHEDSQLVIRISNCTTFLLVFIIFCLYFVHVDISMNVLCSVVLLKLTYSYSDSPLSRLTDSPRFHCDGVSWIRPTGEARGKHTRRHHAAIDDRRAVLSGRVSRLAQIHCLRRHHRATHALGQGKSERRSGRSHLQRWWWRHKLRSVQVGYSLCVSIIM